CADAKNAADVRVEPARPGPVETRGRIAARPGSVEEQQQPVVEDVGEPSKRRIVLVVLAVARVLGQVERQRPMRPKQAEKVFRQPMRLAAMPGTKRRQRRGRKR